MLFPESVPSPQLSVQAAERYAQLEAVAQLRAERRRQRLVERQRRRQAEPKPATAVS